MEEDYLVMEEDYLVMEEDYQVMDHDHDQAIKVNHQAKMIVSLAMKIKMIGPANKIIITKIPPTIKILALDSHLSHQHKAISYNQHQISNQANKTLKRS